MKFKNAITSLLLMSSTSLLFGDISKNFDENSLPSANEVSDIQPYIDASFLVWYGKVNGNAFAQSGIAADGSTGLVGDSCAGKVYDVKYSTQPGFKIGTGVSSKKSTWDVYFNYTWFQAAGSNSGCFCSSCSGTGELLPVFAYSPTGSVLATSTSLTSAHARSILKFNSLDFDVGKLVELNGSFFLKPFFGIKSTYQKQIFRVKYQKLDPSADDIAYLYNTTNNHQRLAGAGLRMGLKSFWSFAKSFGLFFDGAFDLVWASYASKFKSWDNYTTMIANQKYSSNDITPVIEMFAGLSYDLGKDKAFPRFSCKAGWEQQIWFFNNNHSTVLSDNSLNLQGLTLKFLYNF